MTSLSSLHLVCLVDFDDDKLESIWNQGYSLAEFEDTKNFKSYEQLQARLNLVLGKTARSCSVLLMSPLRMSLKVVGGGFNSPDITPSNQPDWGAEVKDFREKAVAASPVEDEDDTLSYFAKLAEED